MSTLLHGLRQLIEWSLLPFDALPAWLGLTLISVLSGAAMLWVFGKTTPQARLATARDRMAASVYEIRLYFDSPRRALAAQGRLLGWSLAYTALMLPAFVVLALPLGLLYLHLETRYGLEPLPTAEPLIVRVALDEDAALDGQQVAAASEQPAGVRITAPALYVAHEHRVYLRLELDPAAAEATQPIELAIDVAGTPVSKRLSTSSTHGPLVPERARGLTLLWSMGHEDPLPGDSGVRSIALEHPAIDDDRWLGLAMPWWAFWLIVATIAALALRKPMRVVL